MEEDRSRNIDKKHYNDRFLLCKLKIEPNYKTVKLFSEKKSSKDGKIYQRHLIELEKAMRNRKNIDQLNRLKVVGASFLEYAVATNLYCTMDNVKPGRLTAMRLEQVSAENMSLLARKNVFDDQIVSNRIKPCIEALIGAYLMDCGPRCALLFISWMGFDVLPFEENLQVAPKSPMANCSTPNAEMLFNFLLDGFESFEQKLNYKFKDRSYLLQAISHNSYAPNQLTESYQRLEFIGDAILNYLVTLSLYEDPLEHSYNTLEELKSALISNSLFTSLAVRYDFHKYFRHLTPGLNKVIDRFVKVRKSKRYNINEEHYLLSGTFAELDEPKVLADVFESVAGAIYLDSNMSLDVVWRVYEKMLVPEIERFSHGFTKSALYEISELRQEVMKFG